MHTLDVIGAHKESYWGEAGVTSRQGLGGLPRLRRQALFLETNSPCLRLMNSTLIHILLAQKTDGSASSALLTLKCDFVNYSIFSPPYKNIF